MDDYQSLSHSKWECKYHVVFIPKCRRKALYGEVRWELGALFRTLAEQKESAVEEGHLLPDHVHMLLSIPPKYAVAQVGGVHQGEERDPDRAAVHGGEAELRGAALLGTGVLRVDRRARRGGDPSVHPGAGGGRSPRGAATADVARHLQVAPGRRS